MRMKALFGTLAFALAGWSFPAMAIFLSTDPAPPNYNTGSNFNRYTYANNNPYRFIDADGRWACVAGSNPGHCSHFEKGLAKVAQAAKSPDLSFSERDVLRRSVAFYGEKGDTSVSISFGEVGGASGQADGHSAKFDMAELTRDTDERTVNAVAKIISHEGDHGWRIRDGSFMKLSRIETEIYGYRAQAYYQKAAQFMDWPGNNGWTSWGGIDENMIKGQAILSVQHACGSTHGCNAK